MSNLFASFRISASGLSAQRRRMDAVASNIANAETTKGKDGSFYKRKRVYFKEEVERKYFSNELEKASVRLRRTRSNHLNAPVPEDNFAENISKVKAIEKEEGPDKFRMVYDPSHPDADENGYVKMPDINIIGEMVDMMVASRSYEANVVAIDATKNMAKRALDI